MRSVNNYADEVSLRPACTYDGGRYLLLCKLFSKWRSNATLTLMSFWAQEVNA
jgi:hypothetical protein